MVYTISELADEFDVSLRTLRFYEEKNIIHPHREARKRIYRERDRVRLALTLRAKRFGLSIMEIRNLLDLYDQENGPYIQLEKSREILLRQAEALRQERLEIDNTIEDLNGVIEQMNDALNGGLSDPCQCAMTANIKPSKIVATNYARSA